MANNNDDPPVQFDCALGQTVKEVPNTAASRAENRQIKVKALLKNNHRSVLFGRSQPVFLDIGQAVNIRVLIKMGKCLGIVTLLFVIFFGALHLASKTSSSDFTDTCNNQYQSLMIKEENKCDYSDTVLDMSTENEILALMEYDEPNVQDMFKESVVKRDMDNRTCKLYDIFQFVFTRLCSLKDEIIAIIPKHTQNGADLRTDVDIPKETSDASPHDELIVDDSG